jgi:hypothetical protein
LVFGPQVSGAAKARLFYGGILCLLLLLDALQAHAIWVTEGLRHQDFFGLWSFAHFARAQPVVQIYQPLALNLYQHWLDPGFKNFFPFPYPPPFLVLLLPLGWLKYWTARLLWTGLSAALFGAVMWRGLVGARDWRMFGVMLALLVPASLSNIVTGETGFFTSALLLGGLLLLPKRQIAAGICFGLLVLKPQLCVLLPFALAGLAAWRATLAAALTAMALVAISLLLPAAMWPAWWAALPQYQGLVAINAAQLAPLMTSFAATAQSFGVAGTGLLITQLAGLAFVGGISFVLFRYGDVTLAIAALLVGTFAATPHAFFYDAPVVAFSVLTLLGRPTRTHADMALSAALLLLPAFTGGRLMLHNFASLLFLALFLRLGWLAVRDRT